MENRRSVRGKLKAECPATTSSDPGAMSSLQEKYAEMDSYLISAQSNVPGESSDGPNSPSDTSSVEFMEDFQTQLKEICSQRLKVEQMRLKQQQRKADLNELHEQQQEQLLGCQMQMEQLSTQYQAEVDNRETFLLKVQQVPNISLSLHDHCQSVKDAAARFTQVRDTLKNSVVKCIETFAAAKEKHRKLQTDFAEMRKIQLAIAQEKEKQQNMIATFKEKRTLEDNRHNYTMAGYNDELSKLKIQIKNKESRLAAARNISREKREANSKIAQKLDEDILQLKKKVTSWTERNENSKLALAKALEEKSRLDDHKIEMSQKIRKSTDTISTLETERIECLKRRETLMQNTFDVQSKAKDIGKDLDKVLARNSDLKATMEELSKRLESMNIEGQTKISQMQESFVNVKTESGARTCEVEQTLLTERQNLDNMLKKCEDTKELISMKKEEVVKVREGHETLMSEKLLKENQLKEKREEGEKLSCALQQIIDRISIEMNKKAQIEESLQMKKVKAQEDLELLHHEIEGINQKITSDQEAVLIKRTNVDLLSQKMKQIKVDSDGLQKSTDEEGTAKIKELEIILEQLQQQKLQMIKENEEISKKRHIELRLHDDLLTNKEMELLEANNTSVKLLKEFECNQTAEDTLKYELEQKIKVEKELRQTADILMDKAHKKDEVLHELSVASQKEKLLIESKLKELHKLRQKITELKNSQADDMAIYLKRKEVCFEEMTKFKQSSEALSNDICSLNDKVDDLKKACAAFAKEREAITMSTEDSYKKKCNYYITRNDKGKEELKTLMKDFEKSETAIKSFERDTQHHNASYEGLYKAITAAKARKIGASSDTLNSSLDTKDRNTEGSIVVKNATEENQVTTPRSILKPTGQPPTPQSDRKKVTFRPSDDLNSSSSTIILEPSVVNEIQEI